MYPPKGYRSFGPIRGLLCGGSDYATQADKGLKLAMIETKKHWRNPTKFLILEFDGIYISHADLSLAVGEEPGFDKSENTIAYKEILRILEAAKKKADGRNSQW